jgi:DtxR family Mn-dependent transcriptional regulator
MTDHALTPALEDYLETIFRLAADTGYARVRDIAAARRVKPGSVSPAMKRLDELGLVAYERREAVRLTETGAAAARKVYSRHQVLRRFFSTFLELPPDVAEADACAAEHALSAQAVDRLVRLFEYMEMCPEGRDQLQRFHHCSLVHDDVAPCPHDCPAEPRRLLERTELMSIADLVPGQRGRVRQVEGEGAIRQRLLDMGLLPDATIELARVAPTGDPLWIKLQGYELALRRTEAAAVKVEAAATTAPPATSA